LAKFTNKFAFFFVVQNANLRTAEKNSFCMVNAGAAYAALLEGRQMIAGLELNDFLPKI